MKIIKLVVCAFLAFALSGPALAQALPDPTCTLTVTPAFVQAGNPFTLKWTTNRSDVQIVMTIDNGIGLVDKHGGSLPDLTRKVTTKYTGVIIDNWGFGPHHTGVCEATVTVTTTPVVHDLEGLRTIELIDGKVFEPNGDVTPLAWSSLARINPGTVYADQTQRYEGTLDTEGSHVTLLYAPNSKYVEMYICLPGPGGYCARNPENGESNYPPYSWIMTRGFVDAKTKKMQGSMSGFYFQWGSPFPIKLYHSAITSKPTQ